MLEDFEYIGWFYLPASKDARFNGSLIFDKENGISIEVLGLYDIENEEIDIINFVDRTNVEFTLFKCHRVGIEYDNSSTWDVIYSIQGHCFETVEDLKFSSINVNFENLNKWVGITGFGECTYNGSETTIAYRMPPAIEFKVDDKIKGSFVFEHSHPLVPKFKATIEERVVLKLKLIH